jgi:SHS2 domain-containing protein
MICSASSRSSGPKSYRMSRGASRDEASEQAALALTAVITDLDKVEPLASITVQRQEADDELLFAEWINAPRL